MKERDALKEEATKNGDIILLKEYRKFRNKVCRSLSKDRSDYSRNKLLGDKLSVKESWKVVNGILGKASNKTPSKIKFNDKIISNPRALAEAFSTIFKEKVDNLRAVTEIQPKIDHFELRF